jgi:hypothetical protein
MKGMRFRRPVSPGDEIDNGKGGNIHRQTIPRLHSQKLLGCRQVYTGIAFHDPCYRHGFVSLSQETKANIELL